MLGEMYEAFIVEARCWRRVAPSQDICCANSEMAEIVPRTSTSTDPASDL
jgi:hypothetical protein